MMQRAHEKKSIWSVTDNTLKFNGTLSSIVVRFSVSHPTLHLTQDSIRPQNWKVHAIDRGSKVFLTPRCKNLAKSRVRAAKSLNKITHLHSLLP